MCKCILYEQLLELSLKGYVPFPLFLLFASWNVHVLATTGAALMDHEINLKLKPTHCVDTRHKNPGILKPYKSTRSRLIS